MKILSRGQLAREQFDRQVPHLQLAAAAFRDQMPRDGWVRGTRKLLEMSMRDFARQIGFRQPASVKDLERNERSGAISLNTLTRAADALNADLVYAIVPRRPIREFLTLLARERVKRSLGDNFQTAQQWQLDLMEGALERKPRYLWRRRGVARQ
jgi:predicted DNA-binding mobile mystery protein A